MTSSESITIDILREVTQSGGEATVVPRDLAAQILRKVNLKFAGLPELTRPLWEYLTNAPSLHDPEGWRMLPVLCGEGDVYLAISDFERMTLVKMSPATLLAKALEHTIPFVFHAFDIDMTYVVCFNDHDVIIAEGAAAPKLQRMSAASRVRNTTSTAT